MKRLLNFASSWPRNPFDLLEFVYMLKSTGFLWLDNFFFFSEYLWIDKFVLVFNSLMVQKIMQNLRIYSKYNLNPTIVNYNLWEILRILILEIFCLKKKKKAIGVITILYIYHESSIKSFSK